MTRPWICIALGLVPFAMAQTITEYNVPTAMSEPWGIAAGSDGALWFTEWLSNKIGRVTTAGVFTEYALPLNGNGGPTSIAAGPDGALWFVMPGAIGRITTAGVISEYPIPNIVPGNDRWITAGSDGAMWFLGGNSGIGRISTSGALTFYKLPVTGANPSAITTGSDGNVWFIDGNHTSLDRITPAGVITQFPVKQGPVPNSLTTGPDGQLWGLAAPFVMSFTTAGVESFSTLDNNAGSGQSLTTGADGAMWYVSWEFGFVDRITTALVDTQFQIPTFDSVPYGIVTGPDGAMWFTERANPNAGAGKIGRISVPAGTAGPSILSGGIVNAASYAQTNGAGDPVAPGSLVAIFTSQLSAQAATFDTQTLPSSLGGVSVTFNGIAAPMVQVAPGGQYPFISAQVPFELAPGTASVVITVGNTPSAAVQEKIVASQPGIFTIPATGQGNAILVFLNPATNAAALAAPAGSSLTSIPSSPIPRGTNAFFYVTGLGVMSPAVADGSGTCPAANGVCNANAMPQVLVGGISAPVAFAGQAPGFPGVFQVNITIPKNAPTGNAVSLVVQSADGSVASNPATIAVQ